MKPECDLEFDLKRHECMRCAKGCALKVIIISFAEHRDKEKHLKALSDEIKNNIRRR